MRWIVLDDPPQFEQAQSAGAAEYTDSISVEE